MKKKILSVLLAGAMTASLFAGCGSDTGNGTGAATGQTTGTETADGGSKDVVTLTFASMGTEPECQGQVLDAVNEKLLADGLNIQIQVKQIDDYWNKLALDIAGGTEYDLAWAHSSTLSDLVAKKVYQPITEALDTVGTDLKAEVPDYVLRGGTVNGEVYAIPRVIPSTGFSNTYDIRKDLMEKYGFEDITTLEELESFFAAIKENEPDVYPVVGPHLSQLFSVYGNYFYFLGDGTYALYIDPADPDATVKSFWESEEFVKMCDKKREWADKGWLISNLSAIENADNGFDYGQVAAVDSNVMRVSERVDALKKNVPEAVAYTVYLEPEQRYIFNAGDNMLAVPSTSKHAKEAVQFIQWFKTNQDNYDLWSYGVKGVNYELNGEAIDISNIPSEDVYSPMTWMWNDIDKTRFSANFAEEEIQRLKDWDNESETSPLVGFVLDQSSIKSETSQILAIMSEYSENLGNGQVNVHDVKDDISKKLKAAGIDKVIEEAQKQVDAYLGK